MSIKEKICMSGSGLIVFLVNLFLYCKFYPGAVLSMPMIGGLFFTIVPWVGGKMIDRGATRIELWEISETGKRRTLIRELSETERKIVARAFRKHPHKMNREKDREIAYAEIALRIAYKDEKQMIFPVKDDNRCFVLLGKSYGVILKEENAQKVNSIIFR